MAERYFNAEQEAHMRFLASIPREQRCASGWHLIGKCYGAPCEIVSRGTETPADAEQGVGDA